MIKRSYLLLITAAVPIVLAGISQALELGLLPSSGNASVTSLPPGLASQISKIQTSGSSSTVPPAPVEQEAAPLSSQHIDYSANMKSDVFGANLFTGAFAGQAASQFNPDYVVAIGDRIQVRLWGSFVYDAMHTVDPQGNIFLPNIGPVKVLGVRNRDLQRVVEESVAKSFRSNVSSYASLAAAQPVRVFVGGYVNRPGLYSGTSMASLLYYLDQAGGVDPERGSFLNVQVRRGDEVRATVNLYDFLLEGRMPLIQFSDGDVIFVNPRQSVVRVTGLAENVKRFEFSDAARTVADLIKVAKPFARATHVRVVRNTGTIVNTEYYALAEAPGVVLQNGDGLEFTADKKVGTITVRVEGEHVSPQEYVLPNGSRLGDLLKKVQFTERSDVANIQLYRQSVRERQRTMFATALRSLETSVLTARSATSDEARLRKDEADLILQWIARAKAVEPSGQVVIGKAIGRDELLLENSDIVKVPIKDGLVLINGEVLFPTTLMFDGRFSVEDYIRQAGGFTQNANTSRIVIAHRDGSFEEAKSGGLFGGNRVNPGDEILILPKIDVKSLQITKDLTQILFQLAVVAGVIIAL